MIRTRSLTKDFVVSRTQTVHAVRGISLEIEPGELVAVLGPNGAGKTTTMRMLTTLIPPTSGTATVAGHDVVAEPAEVRRQIGYVGQGNGAGHTQRVRDELYSQGVIYGLDRRAARQRCDELLEALDLKELTARKVSDLSGGQRRRLDVAMGLVHAPSLLFLDEPSTGLDPQNRANLWEHILAMRTAYDMTIVLTTHYLDEADSMAERVVIVDHGEVIADDTAETLKANLAGDRIVVTTTEDAAHRLAQLASQLPGARDLVTDGAAARVEARVSDGPGALPELMRAAEQSGVRITTAQVHRPTLDDVFLTLTGRSLREAGSDQSTAAPDSAPRKDAA
ncbi:ATP-binding cassette domain-containing protein [Actinopolymorpha alba]|uniref:ATP-binding cassette domain-containing protein n=1 Tax=Actinopolymorpha alba TaxID=533267 RepID=UPI0003743E8D|nr:ATP-binding cassette domain-containing protein [Actinopolymorpha alba]